MEAYKINILSDKRREFVFLYRRCLKVGTVVELWARTHGVYNPITEPITGSKKRKDGLWDIFVMVKGCEKG